MGEGNESLMNQRKACHFYRPIKFVVMALLALLVLAPSAEADFKTMTKYKIETYFLTDLLNRVVGHSQLAYCRHELASIFPLTIYPCNRATEAFREAFDFEANTFGFLTFASEARALMDSPEVLKYIEDLSKHLQTDQTDIVGVAPTLPGGLWNWTLAHPACGGSPVRALQLIAILFQDPKSAGYITLLEKTGTRSNLQRSTSLLYKIHYLFEGIQQVPAGLGFEQENINLKNLYHFYVIAYGSYRMTTATKNPAFGFFMPYLLNRTYELGSIRAREAIAALSEKSPELGFKPEYALIFLDPPTAKSKDLRRNFRSNYVDNSLEDIYLGYRGAIFGTSLALGRPLPAMNRKEFEEAFTRSPFDLTSTIFNSLNRVF